MSTLSGTPVHTMMKYKKMRIWEELKIWKFLVGYWLFGFYFKILYVP